MRFALIRMYSRPMKQEEQDGELYKTLNFLKQLSTSLIIVHRYKQHGMTSMKAFYKN